MAVRCLEKIVDIWPSSSSPQRLSRLRCLAALPSQDSSLCPHTPVCIKFHEGFSNMDDFVENGVCAKMWIKIACFFQVSTSIELAFIVPVDWQQSGSCYYSQSASLRTCCGGKYIEATHLVAGKSCQVSGTKRPKVTPWREGCKRQPGHNPLE